MTRKACCLALLLAITALSADWNPTRDSFDEWSVKVGRTYANNAIPERFEAWKRNLEVVEAHNTRFEAGEVSFRLGMTCFADLKNDEYRLLILREAAAQRQRKAVRSNQGSLRALETFAGSVEVPNKFDWADQGVVTPIKDQGWCGSCWAFSAVAAMESAYNIAHKDGTLSPLCTTRCGRANATELCCSFSEQEIADCTLRGADKCDHGGIAHDGIQEAANRRGELNTEAQYPYVSGDKGKLTKCAPKPDTVRTGVKGYGNITSGDESALVQAVYEKGVISVAVDATAETFQLYSDGVYDQADCKSGYDDLNHAVAVTGFGYGNISKWGPEGCKQKTQQRECEGEEGCHWCATQYSGYCFNRECPPGGLGSEESSMERDVSEEGEGEELLWFMVKNSWGEMWGMNGYIAMSRNKGNQCGIATDAIYAVL